MDDSVDEDTGVSLSGVSDEIRGGKGTVGLVVMKASRFNVPNFDQENVEKRVENWFDVTN